MTQQFVNPLIHFFLQNIINSISYFSFECLCPYFSYLSVVPPACDHTGCFTSDGNLTSANYPNKYYVNTTDSWLITAPAGQTVAIYFVDFYIVHRPRKTQSEVFLSTHIHHKFHFLLFSFSLWWNCEDFFITTTICQFYFLLFSFICDEIAGIFNHNDFSPQIFISHV